MRLTRLLAAGAALVAVAAEGGGHLTRQARLRLREPVQALTHTRKR